MPVVQKIVADGVASSTSGSKIIQIVEKQTGIKLPYIVTIEEASREVLSIRRNYNEADPLKRKINYFVHFKFLPGLGFYGFGLIHMIGGLSRSATQALRFETEAILKMYGPDKVDYLLMTRC